MLSSMLNTTTLPVLEQVVNFTQSRHGVLAGNIANIDTPGYKTRDLSPELFQQNLKQAIDARQTARQMHVSPGITAAREATGAMNSFDEVREATRHVLYHDQSDVSLEAQITELANNQGTHNMAITLMTAQFRLLQAAVTERVV